MSSLAQSHFQLAHKDAVLFGPRSLPVFRISGADAVRYLHGRVTQNIKALTPGHSARSLVLTPQGRIQGQFVLLKEETSFLLVSDPLSTKAAADELLAVLLQFKVADDVSAADLSESVWVYSLIGTRAENHLRELKAFSGQIIPHAWGRLPGYDLVVSRHETVSSIDSAALEMIRISEKIPRMEADLSEKILAPEIELAELASFDKGCYAGQEVVEMATARGRPNRMLALFEGMSGVAPAAGTEIFAAGEEKSCGALTSSCLFPEEGKFRALGFLKTAVSELEEFRAGETQLRRIA